MNDPNILSQLLSQSHISTIGQLLSQSHISIQSIKRWLVAAEVLGLAAALMARQHVPMTEEATAPPLEMEIHRQKL